MRLPKLSAIFLTTAIALGMSGQALALDVGQKGSFAEIEKELAQEKQVEVARAKYILNHDSPSKAKTLCVKFTINAKGEAYILMSDSMDDSKAQVEVVYSKLKNARVYDPHNVGVLPQGVSEQSNLAMLIKRGATGGDGVLMHGESVKKAADGSDVVVGLTTVMANVSGVSDLATNNRVSILLASKNDLISLDKVVATELRYQSP